MDSNIEPNKIESIKSEEASLNTTTTLVNENEEKKMKEEEPKRSISININYRLKWSDQENMPSAL